MSVAWSPDRRAEALVPQRADLIRRLQLVVPAARFVSDDERELIVDDALSYVVMEYGSAISSANEAEEVFWTAARLRVSRTLEGRNATVRGRFERTSDEALNRVADSTDDPAEIVEQILELNYVAEFAASLDELEGKVLRVKWLTEDNALGYRKVAERLAITSARARATERAIDGKLERFATLCAGGRLCAERSEQITAFAVGADIDGQAVKAAKAHIKHCSVCKANYVAQLRAVKSAAFQRQVASLLPGPVAVGGDRHGRLRDLLSDWAGRLIGHDPSGTATQLAATGAGRGAGSVIAVKIAACLAGGAAAVSVCIATGVVDWPATAAKPPARRAQPAATVAPTPTARPTRTPRPAATPKPKTTRPAAAKQRTAAKTQGGTSPSSHEQAPASAAPAGSQPNGASEFGPGPANSPRAPAAPVPAAPGSSEFP